VGSPANGVRGGEVGLVWAGGELAARARGCGCELSVKEFFFREELEDD
jgi:hypothetical protein